MERLAGYLRQRNIHGRRNTHEVSVEQDASSGKATAIHGQRTTPIAETLPGVDCLRTNEQDWDEATLWRTYTMLTDLEAVFRCLKSELGLRPIFHRKTDRVSRHLSPCPCCTPTTSCIQFVFKNSRPPGYHPSWGGIHRELAGQDRVTVTLQTRRRQDGSHRKATRAEPRQQAI